MLTEDQYIINKEAELKELKDKLHSAYEKLDAANEHIQTINEKLDIANADYQLKNEELLEINNDYFRNNINGQLFINNDLLLMKFWPGMLNQIHLLPSDIGKPINHISTDIKFETIIEEVKQVLADGSVITKEIETKNGQWHQARIMPYIQHTDNQKNGAIITFNDITEIKQQQLELDKKNKTLLRINEDLDNFVLAASNALLAPLINIEGSIALMNVIKVPDPNLNNFLTIINTSIRDFHAVITDISTIAKVESDMIPMEMVALNDILNNIEYGLENSIKSSGAVIIRDLKVSHILFSKKNMRCILYSLISNAIKFKRDESPVIHINTIQETNRVILSVQDNGIGIAKNDLDIIFKMYGKLSQDIEGLGIGLYLAKKIVDATSGNIFVESKPGIGSKFMIHFKLEPEY